MRLQNRFAQLVARENLCLFQARAPLPRPGLSACFVALLMPLAGACLAGAE